MTELERPLDPVAALLGRATELGPEERDAARERFLQRAERELGLHAVNARVLELYDAMSTSAARARR